MVDYPTLAAVDLGSNSFRLQVARVVDEQIYPLDSLKETVRLAAGLGADCSLEKDTQEQALACLRRFGERLRGMPKHTVRAVGTNTLRVAKNSDSFLERARQALGFPIEIIPGREEARLIYLGVSHSLPPADANRLVVDIGGGSTEFIVGRHFLPRTMESVYMGCVTYSRRFFPDGKITARALRDAELAARAELQSVAGDFARCHWGEAIGSSGTARALTEALQANGFAEEGITADGLRALRALLLKQGEVRKLTQIPGLRAERAPVFVGGFAIMNAAFAELDIDRMTLAEGALREGVLHDLVGRFQHHDVREATVKQLMRRYHVDVRQARRVEQLAQLLLERVADSMAIDLETARRRLEWAARLHEIGLDIAHSSYHKHSAYVVEHADMPGFSTPDKAKLSALLRAQRGSLTKVADQLTEEEDWPTVLALRLAVLFHRRRADFERPRMDLQWEDRGFVLLLEKSWLKANPLSETMLEAEKREWAGAGLCFRIAGANPEALARASSF